jgi:four helix bundle protein
MLPDVNFRKLDVYQIAVRFLPIAASIADSIPPRYTALADQLRRASISIPLNIAEGSGKSTGPDQRRFYTIARGSAMECAAIVDACTALELIEQPKSEQADQLLLSAVRMLSKLCRVQEHPSRSPSPGPGPSPGPREDNGLS